MTFFLYLVVRTLPPSPSTGPSCPNGIIANQTAVTCQINQFLSLFPLLISFLILICAIQILRKVLGDKGGSSSSREEKPETIRLPPQERQGLFWRIIRRLFYRRRQRTEEGDRQE